MSFMVFVLILSPQTLVKSTEEKEPSEYHCISVQASDYFCSPSNQTGNSQNCFGALLAIYPMVLSILCLFAFSAHLWFTFKSQMPNFCDWILSGFFMLAWLAAFAIMIYVCVANVSIQYLTNFLFGEGIHQVFCFFRNLKVTQYPQLGLSLLRCVSSWYSFWLEKL